MSAHIAEKETIDALVTFATSAKTQWFEFYRDGRHVQYPADEIGQKLVEQNFKSVNSRYSLNEAPYKYRYRTHLLPLKNAALYALKLSNYLAYQSCEDEGWLCSDAYFILTSIKEIAIRRLPGYDDAPWGL